MITLLTIVGTITAVGGFGGVIVAGTTSRKKLLCGSLGLVIIGCGMMLAGGIIRASTAA